MTNSTPLKTAIGIAAGILVGAAAVAGGSAAIAAVDANAKTYATNAAGSTYGSAGSARSFESEPDLIAAIATNGQEGYVRKGDLRPPVVTSPEEAVAQNARYEKGITVPVVANDGRTVLGEFVIGGESGHTLAEDGAALAR